MTDGVMSRTLNTELKPLVFWSGVVATVLTIFDGVFTYWIVNQGAGREANPILTTFVSYFEAQGMSYMDAFGLVMFFRVLIGILMIVLLAIGTAYPRKRTSWLTRNGLPLVAGILVALTIYSIVGYITVFQYR